MRKLFITLFLAVALFSVNDLSAQIITMEEGSYFNSATSVSNEGVVCGYEAFRSPYELWYPETNTRKIIGGVGPGDGVGGRGVFSADGKFISGSAMGVKEISTEWRRKVLDRNCNFLAIAPTLDGTYAVGNSVEENKGIVASASAGGGRERRWTEVYGYQFDTHEKTIMTISLPAYKTGKTSDTGYIGGYGVFGRLIDGQSWEEMTPIAENVTCYKVLDFSDGQNGVAGVEAQNGWMAIAAVYVTADGGTSWAQANGLYGAPVSITHVSADIYYMVTDAGVVQKSTDKGNTWSNIATDVNHPRKIKFYDAQNGMITAQGAVYKTTDGGATWNSITIAEGVTGQITWNDVAWQDAQNIILVGSNDVIYTSADGGNTWTWANEAISDGKTQLNGVSVNDKYIHVCGESSTIYTKALFGKEESIGMAIYDVEKGEWRTLGDLGGLMGDTTGGGYAISGDGKTVVGNGWADFDENKLYDRYSYMGYCSAMAWSEQNGCMDLGTLIPEDNARCNAVSNDGSVIVGYQARSYVSGLWVSAVWRRNDDGGYTQSYLFKDPAIGEKDEANFMPECTAVSANGKWIGGANDYFLDSSWIWSEETGVIKLGATEGIVYISDDGEFVAGHRFIWTKEKGSMSIMDYLVDVKGYDLSVLNGNELVGIQSVSPNGNYFAGFGQTGSALFSYRVDLTKGSGVEEETVLNRVTVYPNPVSEVLTINIPGGNAELKLFDSCGRMVFSRSVTASQTDLQVSDMAGGLYFLNVSTQGSIQTHKVEIVH